MYTSSKQRRNLFLTLYNSQFISPSNRLLISYKRRSYIVNCPIQLSIYPLKTIYLLRTNMATYPPSNRLFTPYTTPNLCPLKPVIYCVQTFVLRGYLSPSNVYLLPIYPPSNCVQTSLLHRYLHLLTPYNVQLDHQNLIHIQKSRLTAFNWILTRI